MSVKLPFKASERISGFGVSLSDDFRRCRIGVEPWVRRRRRLALENEQHFVNNKSYWIRHGTWKHFFTFEQTLFFLNFIVKSELHNLKRFYLNLLQAYITFRRPVEVPPALLPDDDDTFRVLIRSNCNSMAGVGFFNDSRFRSCSNRLRAAS